MLPEPFYKHDGCEIYNASAGEVLAYLPPVLTVTDPPYNVGYGYDLYGDKLALDDYWAMITQTIKPPCVVIHYPEALFELAIRLGYAPSKVIAWVYNANTPRQWRAIGWWGIEPDLTLQGQPYKNPEDKRVQKLIERGLEARLYDWWHIDQIKNVSSEKTEHPCQIPLALMKRILAVTPYDGPVCDPYMGSGTTLRAAKDLGRRAIGIEISEAYCAIARGRLSQAVLL